MSRWESSFPEPHGAMPQNPRDAEPGHGHEQAYRCLSCDWRGRGVQAVQHWKTHPTHRIRGVDWPQSWPDAFSGEVHPSLKTGGRHGAAA
jgi:hypothetical protein